MTTTDRARADAERAVAAILRGRLAPTLDAGHVAALVLDELHGLDWRHVPRPAPLTAQGRKDAATAHRGADAVRKAFDRALAKNLNDQEADR
ncbi:hypothetical protein [Actinomadura litoris]|uniref:hypothetical protein n=1 Tax=Actinomadura litoris TaxID=2678616 RepID=UPI001FA7A90A|nr:hypothetical protein [Actinomadura litoris]